MSFLKGKTVLCGFSGGADSLYLLLELKNRSAEEQFVLKAVHFNHGFRGAESDGDELFCRDTCAGEQIPFQSFSLNVPHNRLPGEGDEAASRRLRLALWKKLTSDGNTVIALAHHAGDLTENLFLRLCRGSNSGGLTSLREFSTVEGICFWRPLLKLSKADIVHSLNLRGLVWRTDSTNMENVCFRNYLRNTLLPGLFRRVPFAERGILQSASVLAEDADFLNQEAEKAFRAGLDWKKLHPAILIRVLRLFLRKKTGEDLIPTHDFAEAFSALLHAPCLSDTRILAIPGTEEFFFRFRDGYDPVLERRSSVPSPVLWSWKKEKEVHFGKYVFSAEIVSVLPEKITADVIFLRDAPEELMLRTRRTGDRMSAAGHTGTVSVAKLLSNVKLDPEERDKIPVLVTLSGGILWLPRIRKHISADCGQGSFLKITVIGQ